MNVAIVCSGVGLNNSGFFYEKAFKKLGYNVLKLDIEGLSKTNQSDYDYLLRIDDGSYCDEFDWVGIKVPTAYLGIGLSDVKAMYELSDKFAFSLFEQRNLSINYSATRNTSAFVIPPACDPEIHFDMGTERPKDVIYIGERNDRTKEFLYLVESEFPNLIFGSDSNLTELMNSTKVYLNKPYYNEITQNLFVAMACGAYVIAEEIFNGYDKLFGRDYKFGIYLEPAQCIKKIHEVLNDYEKFSPDKNDLKKFVLEYHTYLVRAYKIMDIMRSNEKIIKDFGNNRFFHYERGMLGK